MESDRHRLVSVGLNSVCLVASILGLKRACVMGRETVTVSVQVGAG